MLFRSQLELLARKIFRGLLRGEHTTSRRGRGLEFSDFRHYRPGDDFRHIDWNIYSRLDQLFLKLHASEDDVTLHLILDTSASMGFGEPSKIDQARRLAAALAYIALHNLDRVGVSSFSGGMGPALPPIKTRNHMARLLTFLGELPCAGPTRFDAALRAFATRTRNPGLVILISDLLGAGETDAGAAGSTLFLPSERPPRGLVLVGGPDPPARGADLQVREAILVAAIQGDVVGHRHVGAAADPDPADVDAARDQHVQLGDEEIGRAHV